MGNLSGRLGLGQNVKDLECWAEDQDFALWAVDDTEGFGRIYLAVVCREE